MVGSNFRSQIAKRIWVHFEVKMTLRWHKIHAVLVTDWKAGFVFTQLLSKVIVYDARAARRSGVKIEFDVRSFKDIQGHVFWDPWKPTRDSVSLCHNAGLISKVSEDTASENTENCCCRQLHCRLTPLGNPREYPVIGNKLKKFS